MQLHSKIGKTPEELAEKLTYKTMKALIKKDLRRLEKTTSADKPTQVMVLGDHPYPDKPAGVGLILIGNWKGAFKKYAKETVVKDELGAVGQVYFGGTGADGQKIIQIDLAKGKGKAKTAKIAKGLKKLIPQATCNVVFGEMSEDALLQLEQQLDQEPQTDEPEEMLEDSDDGEIDIEEGQNIQQLLDSNLVELSDALKNITTAVYPRLKAKTPQEDDADAVVDTLDLANEWLELHREAPEAVRQLPQNLKGLEKVQHIIQQITPMLALLGKMGVNPTAGTAKNITASVGNMGKNLKDDVIIVQTLLNERGANPALTVDGSCGKMTINAILAFQQQTFGRGDGRVDAGGDTWKALLGNANAPQPNPNNPPVLDPLPPADKPLPAKLKGKTVGKNGDNYPEDVRVVQVLLNKKLRLGLAENGVCDTPTIEAIKTFQANNFGAAYADGVINVAGGMTMAAGNITWKALRGSGRADMGAPADVDATVTPMGNTSQGLPDQVVICAPKTGDPKSLPVIIVIGGMHGYGGQFMVDCVPASLFAKAVIIGAGFMADWGFLQKAYQAKFGAPLSKGQASICGFSAGGNVQNYMSGFKTVGLIDPVASVAWAQRFSAKVILSANSRDWSRKGIMPDVYTAAKKTGATVEDTTISHGAYPEYFLSKFAGRLL